MATPITIAGLWYIGQCFTTSTNYQYNSRQWKRPRHTISNMRQSNAKINSKRVWWHHINNDTHSFTTMILALLLVFNISRCTTTLLHTPRHQILHQSSQLALPHPWPKDCHHKPVGFHPLVPQRQAHRHVGQHDYALHQVHPKLIPQPHTKNPTYYIGNLSHSKYTTTSIQCHMRKRTNATNYYVSILHTLNDSSIKPSRVEFPRP